MASALRHMGNNRNRNLGWRQGTELAGRRCTTTHRPGAFVFFMGRLGMIPDWLHTTAILSLALAVTASALIALDEMIRPQSMWIMNVVWPTTALFGSLATLVGYLRYGRNKQDSHIAEPSEPPFAIMVAKAACHCGSGCAIGDLMAESLAFAFPAVAVWFGWHPLFAEKMFAVWGLDYAFAFVLGIAFQYFTIKPMRDLSPRDALVQAMKADVLSLTAWQVGMYGFMALAQFYFFRQLFGTRLNVATPEFWFMMQIAMVAGFVTSYAVNWWLIRRGIKERM
jgi:hypothetical protein